MAGVLTTVSMETSDTLMLFAQDPPVEPESPPNASQHEDTEIKQEEEGGVQHPEDKVGGGTAAHLPRPSSWADSLFPVSKATCFPEENRFKHNLSCITWSVSLLHISTLEKSLSS